MHKFIIKLTCNDDQQRLILPLGSSESVRHLAMKLLAYCVFFDRRPAIELSVGQHFKPDLVCQQNGDITLWVECGDVDISKLDKVARRNRSAELVVVKPTKRLTAAYKQQADKKVRDPERIRYLTFDDGFLKQFVTELPTRCDLQAAVNQDRLEVEFDETELETRLHWL